MDATFTAQEYADILGVNEKFVRRKLIAGEIRGIMGAGKRWTIGRKEAVRYAVSQGVPPDILRQRLNTGSTIVGCGMPKSKLSAGGLQITHTETMFDMGIEVLAPGVWAAMVAVDQVGRYWPADEFARFAKRVDRPLLVGFVSREVKPGVFDKVYPEFMIAHLDTVVEELRRNGA